MTDDKLVVVTGAGSGIGEATARRLQRGGTPVLAVDMNEAALDALQAVAVVVGDVADATTWQRVAAALERLPSPRGLVSNAAIAPAGTVETLSEADWHRTFEVNVFGAVHGMRTMLPLIAAGGGGAVVTVGSTDSFTAEQNMAAYCSSKGALLQLSRAAALDAAPMGITVNCVCPGVTDTPMFRGHLARFGGAPQAAIAGLEDRIPIGRLIRPADVAAAICALLSDDMSAVTGALIPVDGGLSAGLMYAH
jgi:NAD(P)-dependent dehydrogenase (short-subunit alcohol dehydrogenase family)